MTDPKKANKKDAQKSSKLPKYVLDNLYQVQQLLDKRTRKQVGLSLDVPVFIKDPLVASEDPALGVQEISIRLEVGMGDGPTSSRVVVVDFNADTQQLFDPVTWDAEQGWFHAPATSSKAEGERKNDIEWLPKAPPKDSQNKGAYQKFIEKTIRDPYFHQLNVWGVVQRVLEFYEEPSALGRPVPWGFDGNRLIVVPHAGYGENAFYDQNSKSLQFYYFGDLERPGYTCLSHDIIAHETGHAILDGIRPLYNQLSSLQTLAFHEFIGDLTAILLALFNKDIRHFVSQTTKGRLGEAGVLANIAEEFGREVEGRPYLRTAFNKCSLQDQEIKDSLSPHNVSQVMTGAMWDILTGIATKHLDKNLPLETNEADVDDLAEESSEPGQKVTPAQALWWAADRFRRVALQPLDLCPPCDIQFVDYANAVIRNDILTNPVDAQGYRPIMLEVFHRRGLCDCGYQPGKDLPKECKFQDAQKVEKIKFVYHDIERLSSSRTAAYYFLSDNRTQLHIPAHQDVRVVDLYDNRKFGAAAERLPREIVLEYAWQEEVLLENDPGLKLDFGAWQGKTFDLDCGGTLVFDGRGNLMSWFRKPGTEHIAEKVAEDIQQRLTAWQDHPNMAKKQEVKRPTKQEQGELADWKVGRQRKAAVKEYLAEMIRNGLVGPPQPESGFSDGMKPVTALEEGGGVCFQTTPHLRKQDFDAKEEGWTVNY
jgi:hypothetical protein